MLVNRIKRFVPAVAALLIVIMISGTWAYWTQELTLGNQFQSGKYSTRIQVDFKSPDKWLPGVEVNKDVSMANDGTLPVFVKATISQKWLRMQNIYDDKGNIISPAEGEAFPLTFDRGGISEYAAQITWGLDVVLLGTSETSAKAALALGLPLVNNIQEASGKWVLINEKPDHAGNFTFYYVGVLSAGKTTPLLIDSVTMNPLIQPEAMETEIVWDEDKQEWLTTTTLENTSYGYENARYTLGVTLDSVQAAGEALAEMFPADTVSEQSVISYLVAQGINKGDQSITGEKILYFNEVNGNLVYTPAGTGDKSWFMSHLNLAPGEICQDMLRIENRSNQAFKLFLQVIPKDAEKIEEQLLNDITMKVYYDNAVIYDGSAYGKAYANSINNLNHAVFLGNHEPLSKAQIRVELQLSKDVPMERAGVLSNVDWKFTAEMPPGAEPSIDPPPPVNHIFSQMPKTGDDSNTTYYIMLMSACGLLLIGCVLFYLLAGKRRKKEENKSDK